jgi:hypothetical protein
MVIRVKKAEVSLQDGNIIKVDLNDDVHLQPNDLGEINRARLQLNCTGKCGILLISGNGSTISKETLEMMCDPSHAMNYSAKAIVVNLLAEEYLRDFFKKHNTDKFPIAVFSSKVQALKWLKEKL